jgi:hypothetical protein
MKTALQPGSRAQPAQRAARPAWSEPAPHALDTSPAMLAQRKRIESAFGPAARLPAQRRLAPGTGPVQLLPMQSVAQFGGFGTAAWTLGGGLLGGLAGASALGLAPAVGLGLAGGYLGKKAYDWATQDPERPEGLVPDEENPVEQGHDEDEEDGAEALEFDLAEPEDINRGEDPELYKRIEALTLDFSRLRIDDGEGVDDFQRSSVHSNSGGLRNRDGPRLFKKGPFQLARGPGPSYQDFYSSTSHGDYEDVEYTRDGKGSFNFAKRPIVYKGGQWKNPVQGGSQVDLAHGSKDKKYGITSTNRKVKLVDASRGVHFNIANRIKKNGAGNTSPAGWTWHHLPQEYKMVLVDRRVHQKHGHNGGKFLWS